MDPLTAASLAQYQYQLAYQAGGQGAGVAQALGSAQALASQTAALLPGASGPAALLELSPEALQASATYAAASQNGQGASDVQALLAQATAARAGTTATLVSGGTGFQDPATAEAVASYQYLQAQASGQNGAVVLGLVNGGNGASALLNTLI